MSEQEELAAEHARHFARYGTQYDGRGGIAHKDHGGIWCSCGEWDSGPVTGTPQVNCLRGISPAAQQAKQTHCKRGHPFDAKNTYMNKGKRYCRICGQRGNAEAFRSPMATVAATAANLDPPS